MSALRARLRRAAKPTAAIVAAAWLALMALSEAVGISAMRGTRTSGIRITLVRGVVHISRWSPGTATPIGNSSWSFHAGWAQNYDGYRRFWFDRQGPPSPMLWAPLWPVALPLVVFAIWVWRHPKPEDPACPRCGYALAGLTSDRCPECGEAIKEANQ